MKMQALRALALGIPALAAAAFGSTGGACAADTIRYGIDDAQNINRLPQVVAEREVPRRPRVADSTSKAWRDRAR
jgi:hypothetical protein